MCGIFGFFNYRNDDGDLLLQKMAAQQVHRGPDSDGFYRHESFGFGIRRLSVLDLETGDQPIANEDDSVSIVCNGEIYNYIELRAELEAKGHIFKTASDVECMVHIYEDDGIDGIKRLNGMYGFALYDSKLRKLFLVRDRLGVKPLYYSRVNGTFLFASELKSILTTGLVANSLDWNAISYFLDELYIPTPFSPFSAIKKIKPGHLMMISEDDCGAPDEKPYWDLNDGLDRNRNINEHAAVEELQYLMQESTRIQLRADVPICVFLSGGVDSSAVAAFAARQVSRPLRTFHVHFKGASHKLDETEQARLVASQYGTNHSEVDVGRDDFKRLIPRIVWHTEEPFGDLATVPTYIISEMAKKDATVCLNGSGGDELFAGYSQHNYPYHVKESIAGALEKLGILNPLKSIMGREVQRHSWSNVFPEYRDMASRKTPEDKGHTFKGDLRNKFMARDIDGYLQSNVLFLLDKVAMAVSLEGRVPLLDHRLVEFATHLPSRLKIRNGQRKYIFKKALEPYLPSEVLCRQKEGFGAPLQDWLNNDMKTILRNIIKDSRLRKDQLLLLPDKNIDSLDGWFLWKIACLDLWFRIVAMHSSYPGHNTLTDYV